MTLLLCFFFRLYLIVEVASYLDFYSYMVRLNDATQPQSIIRVYKSDFSETSCKKAYIYILRWHPRIESRSSSATSR